MHETMSALEWQFKDCPQRYAFGVAVEPGSVWCTVCLQWYGPGSFHAWGRNQHASLGELR